MKCLKAFGLAAVAAMALMAFGVGSASATILTTPVGTQVPVNTKIIASIETGTTAILHTSLQDVTCTSGIVEGAVGIEGSAIETVLSLVTNVAFANCNCERVEDVIGGTFEVHTDNNGTTSNGNGTLTSNGTTAIITCSGITCKYITSKSHMGTLTGSINTHATATMDVNAELIRETGSSFLCSEKAKWEASYVVTSPDYLDVD